MTARRTMHSSGRMIKRFSTSVMRRRSISKLRASMLLALFCAHALIGCAGVGVVETADPAQKLRDAEVLFTSKDRPLIAERLIREALSISQAQSDDSGVASAYRTYGFFFRSSSVAGSWSQYYREKGFLEPSVTWDTRLDGSVTFFKKSAELYDRLSLSDASSNVYLNLGHTYDLMHDAPSACGAYSAALDRFHQNMRAHPDARPQAPAGFGSFEDFLNSLRKQDGCGGVVVSGS